MRVYVVTLIAHNYLNNLLTTWWRFCCSNTQFTPGTIDSSATTVIFVIVCEKRVDSGRDSATQWQNMPSLSACCTDSHIILHKSCSCAPFPENGFSQTIAARTVLSRSFFLLCFICTSLSAFKHPSLWKSILSVKRDFDDMHDISTVWQVPNLIPRRA